MLRKLLAITGILAFITICWAATNTPWTGVEWDSDSPDIDQPLGNAYKEIYSIRKGIETRMNKEHETLASSSAGGVHKQGSARAFFQDTAPTTQIDGSAWDSGDTGSLWFDTNSSPDNLFYVLTDPASTGTWTLLSTSMIAEIVAAAHQWADVQTFDVQTVHTLGLLSNANITLGSGADLIGSATSAINMQAFDVDENGIATLGTSLDIAGTIAVVGTIDDDTMATATNTTVATAESIKAYVDDATGLRCRMYLNADQSIATGTDTIIAFTTDTYDADAIGTTGATAKITPAVTGYYVVTACTKIELLDNVKAAILKLFKNTTLNNQFAIASAGAQRYSMMTSDVIYLDADDYVQVKIYHNNGSNLNIIGSTTETYITLQRVGI